MTQLVLALLLTAAMALAAQISPVAGVWAAEVESSDGPATRFVITLRVDGDIVEGTLKIGASREVPIENGRLRGDVVSFRRTMADRSRVEFLARVVDDGLRVGFMRVPAGEAAGSPGSSKVVNFTARRVAAPLP